MRSFVGAFGCPRLRGGAALRDGRIRRAAGYIGAALLAVATIIGIAVATLPKAAWAKPHPADEFETGQGWPVAGE